MDQWFRHRVGFYLIAAACATTALSIIAVPFSAAAKSPVPFKGRVAGTWDNVYAALPTPQGPGVARFTATSEMTLMGRAAQTGTLTLTPSGNPVLIPGHGSVTVTAPNGDSVKFDYTGILNAMTGEGTGNFTITGGTGRFTGATGGGTFYAQIDLSQQVHQALTVVLDGRITY